MKVELEMIKSQTMWLQFLAYPAGQEVRCHFLNLSKTEIMESMNARPTVSITGYVGGGVMRAVRW